MSKTFKFTGEVSFSAPDLVDALNREALISLVEEIDAHVACWDFTIKLADYFAAQRKEHDAEKADGAKP